MREQTQASSVGGDQTALLQLFGPPPVLSSESVHSYQEIMDQLMQCFAPRDFMERILIKEVVDCTWEMVRYNRYKTLVMERRFRQRLAFQAQRQKAAAQGKDARGQHREPPKVPEDVLDGLVEEVDAMLLKPAAELDHARALEVGIVHHECLDQLLLAATLRRNNALDQLERYREKFGQRLRRLSDEIIDVEINAVVSQSRQVAGPGIPTGEQQQ